MRKIHVAIFASGSGTNAEEFFKYFRSHNQIEISTLYSNNANAFALTRASNHQIPSVTFTRKEFYHSSSVIELLKESSIDFIVLAGFMWLIPTDLVQAYPERIINIHPALLPKFGGKGMYGNHVHKAAIEANEAESGITIHYVNDRFDEGKIVFQKTVEIVKGESPESLANKIHLLEYAHYPEVAERTILDKGYLFD